MNFALHASLVFWVLLLLFLPSTTALCVTLVISHFSISKPSETRKEVVVGWLLYGRRPTQSSVQRKLKRSRGPGFKSALLLTHPASLGRLLNRSGFLWRGITGLRTIPSCRGSQWACMKTAPRVLQKPPFSASFSANFSGVWLRAPDPPWAHA